MVVTTNVISRVYNEIFSTEGWLIKDQLARGKAKNFSQKIFYCERVHAKHVGKKGV